MKSAFLYLLFILFAGNVYSQVQDTSKVLEQINTLLEDASENDENTTIYDNLEYLLQNRIKLNFASVEELLQIPYLNRATAAAIIKQRNLLGEIKHFSQVEYIDEIGKEIIKYISPFIDLVTASELYRTNTSASFFRNFDISIRSRAIILLKEQKGFIDNKFEGSSEKIYNRVVINKADQFRLALLMEKDPGESNLNDFTTIHLFAKDIWIFKKIIFGDFFVEFGQGLAMWSPYSLFKGTETVNILPKNERGIIPYLSTNENQFLRGISSQFEFKGFTLNTFYSYRYLDANLDPWTQSITSLFVDGYHRSENEKSKKDKVTERLFGSALKYNFNIGSVGLLYYNSTYNYNFESDFALREMENSFSYLSSGYSANVGKLNITGETSFYKNSLATLNTLDIYLSKNMSIIFSYRNYGRDYWNNHSGAFGESSHPQNEEGFYLGAKVTTAFGNFNFYFDQYKKFSTSQKLPFSSNGYDFLLNYTLKLKGQNSINVKYKYELSEEETKVEGINILSNLSKQNIRGEYQHTLFKDINLRSRFELVKTNFTSTNEYGFLCFQDVRYSYGEHINVYGRIIYFKTDSYLSRVYEFENDLAGIVTNTPLYGVGLRWYLMAKYSFPIGLSLSLKYSELYKPDEKFLGSGDNLINGNKDNRLNIQLDYLIN